MIRVRPPVSSLLVLTACIALGCSAEEWTGRGDDSSVSRASPSGGVRIIDAAGAELWLSLPARRVVSLVPSATQTLRAMGAESVLVGRTDFDAERWAAHLPSVGGGIGPNLEAIAALEPDLVVRFAGEQDTRTPLQLNALGIPQLAVRPDRVEDIYRTTLLLGQATGYEVAADSLVGVIRSGLADVAAKVRALPRVRVAYLLGGTPPWVSGPDTYIDEVIALAGGRNAFADLAARYSAVSPEELRARRIDVVLLSSRGVYDRTLTPGARVEVVEDALEIPGPGVAATAHHVAELIHGRSLP